MNLSLKFLTAIALLASLFSIGFIQANVQWPALVPVAWEGRFQPASTYARHWLYEHYHRHTLLESDLKAFHQGHKEPISLLWELHFKGHKPFKNSPLFWIQRAELKHMLGLNPKQERFSYTSLKGALKEKRALKTAIATKLMLYHFFTLQNSQLDRLDSTLIELKQLQPGLWLQIVDKQIIVAKVPSIPLWQKVLPGQNITDNLLDAQRDFEKEKEALEELQKLISKLHTFKELLPSKHQALEKSFTQKFDELRASRLSNQEIALQLEQMFPLAPRLEAAGHLLKVLPGRLKEGVWYSPSAFHAQVYDQKTGQLILSPNFTLYEDALFFSLRRCYFIWEEAIFQGDRAKADSYALKFKDLLTQGYSSIAKKTYLKAAGKTLTYPSYAKLYAENAYFHMPLISLCIIGYSLALMAFFLSYSFRSLKIKYVALGALIVTFALHTVLLILRSYILTRPPVANMFETALYVPWVGVFVSLCLFFWLKSPLLLSASALSSVALLSILKFSQLNDKFENLQAVLDSQYWLTIHVLLVVASYGIFLLGGILGHFYLVFACKQNQKGKSNLKALATTILQTTYLGTAFLIAGTLLGGVWAAESWGRFWDWDPKESWAFISICIYIALIHAYRFGKIGHLGLAAGAIIGLMMVSFTWYGVNYILGTGMHSYGFGSGGQSIYYSYLFLELVFVTTVAMIVRRRALAAQIHCK